MSKNVQVLRGDDRSLQKVAEGKEKGVRPSETNHSSVPFDSPNSGVTIEYAKQTTTLSLICLRRLRFPTDSAPTPEADAAARTVLAALGLCAATLAFESGMGLRSRCLLWPEGPMTWELLDHPGGTPKSFTLSSDGAVKLLGDAIAEATSSKLPWPEAPIALSPSEELVKLVRLSQQRAVREALEGS